MITFLLTLVSTLAPSLWAGIPVPPDTRVDQIKPGTMVQVLRPYSKDRYFCLEKGKARMQGRKREDTGDCDSWCAFSGIDPERKIEGPREEVDISAGQRYEVQSNGSKNISVILYLGDSSLMLYCDIRTIRNRTITLRDVLEVTQGAVAFESPK